MKLAIEYVLIFITVVLFQACDLDLQKSYDFDENDRPEVVPPFNMTIYDFMIQNADFDSLVLAVDRTGMEDIFNGGEIDKTVLLLRNEAMVEFLDDQGYNSVAEVPIATLQNLLNYHVITTRFTQEDILVEEYIVFQTLTEGNDGKINIWKWRRYWEIRINTGGPDLPSTAKGETVYLHNYEFNNGVVHQMDSYVKRVPF